MLRIAAYYIAISTFLAWVNHGPLNIVLRYLLEILPGLYYLTHVLLVAYDTNDDPAYTKRYLQAANNCSPRRCNAARRLAFLYILAWLLMAQVLAGLDVGALLLYAAIGGGALFLNARKGWVGACSLLCMLGRSKEGTQNNRLI